MKKFLLLFLSLLGTITFAQNPISIAKNCDNKAFIDSLVTYYLENKANKIDDYNNPDFQSYCDSVLMICPNVAVAYRVKSMPYMKGGDFLNGMKYLNKAVENDPEKYTDYRAFMKCIFTKDYEGAIVDFNKAEIINANKYVMDHSYPFYRGLCYLELKNYKQAEQELLKDIVKQTKNDSTVTAHFNSYLYLGIIYFKSDQHEKASEFLNKSLSQYQNSPVANYYYSLNFDALKNKDKAKEYMLIAKKSIENGQTMNEDNEFYAYYPHQISIFEIEKQLLKYNEK